MANIELRRENKNLFVRVVILSTKTMGNLVHRLDERLFKPIFEKVLTRLPKKVYRYVILEVMKMALELSLKQQFSFDLKESVEYFMNELVDIVADLSSQSLSSMSGTCEFLTILLDLLQIQLSKCCEMREIPFPR